MAYIKCSIEQEMGKCGDLDYESGSIHPSA